MPSGSFDAADTSPDTSPAIVFPLFDPTTERGIKFGNPSKITGTSVRRANLVQQIISAPIDHDAIGGPYSGAVRYRYKTSTPTSVLGLGGNLDVYGNPIFGFTGRPAAASASVNSLGHIFDANAVTLWRFDETQSSDNPVDEAGNTVLQKFGPQGPTVVAGRISLARQSDEMNYFQGTGNSTLGTTFNGEWTVEFWLRIASSDYESAGAETLVFYGGQDFSSDALEGLMMSISLTGGAGYRKVAFNFQESNLTINSVESISDLSIDTWHHIGLSRELIAPLEYSYKLYIDGALDVDTDTTGLTLNSPSGSAATHFICVCNYISNTGTLGETSLAHFKGRIDDVRISNICRSGSEILESYERGMGL